MTTERILIVDDNPTNRTILSVSLRKAGYEIREAEDGGKAVDIAVGWPPDLILLDIDMPAMDGFEVCAALKARAEVAHAPVIFLTAMSGPSHIERAFAVGGSDYVTKPFHLSEVKARVSVHLQLRRARNELAAAHRERLQAQKLEAIGQLAAGIAHEINTPTQYVGDNTRFLQDAFADIAPLLAKARALALSVRAELPSADLARGLEQELERADLDYLGEEIPRAIRESLEGLGRVTRIVGAMKDFSHPSATEKEHVDLNRTVESTVTVSSSEWKYVAELVTDLDPELPAVPCLPGEIGQVLLNVIVNAAHAVADVVGDGAGGKGRITVTTRRSGGFAEIRVADTGTGIPADVRDKVFDPFFTTKEVGKGTGQGLSIAHSVVVQKHGGTIDFETEPGRGTTFLVRLPLAPA